MEKKNRNKLLLMLAIIILAMLSCADLYVQNNTQAKLRVMVSMPGESVAETALIPAGQDDIFVSDYSGQYTVQAMPDEEYRASLMDLKETMQTLLVTGFSYMDVEEIKLYIQKISNIDKILDSLDTIACSGEIDDESLTVEINVNPATNKMELSCP
ncbi:MAG: hypothetical protein ACK2T7_10325 [Anaerolineales bacterium]